MSSYKDEKKKQWENYAIGILFIHFILFKFLFHSFIDSYDDDGH